MLLFSRRIFGSQRGSVMSTNLVLFSGIAIATVAIITMGKNLRKSSIAADVISAERRVNESALQAVSQLVSNGYLHFDKNCGRLQPTLTQGEFSDHVAESKNGDSQKSDYEVNGCGAVTRIDNVQSLTCGGSDDSKWLYLWDEVEQKAKINLCVRAPKFGKSEAENANKLIPVVVTINRYEEKKDDRENVRNYAVVQSRPVGKNSRGSVFSSLNARISLGLTSGNAGLLGRHGAADTCYFMRPLTSKQVSNGAQNLAFRARSKTGEYTWEELEPRPDGPNADEFQQLTDLSQPDPTEDDYAVLNKYREEKIAPAFLDGLRGGRPSTSNWGVSHYSYNSDVLEKEKIPDVIRKTFIGVVPKIENGPRFQYFLYAVPGTKNPVDHRQDRVKFNHDDRQGLEYGCNTTTKRLGLMDTTYGAFCSKVYIPLYKYRATLKKKCITTTQTLPSAPVGGTATVMNADRAVMTSCHPEWADTVEKIVKQINQHVHGIHHNNTKDEDDFSAEITAAMAISAMEADDDFINGTGAWADLKKSQSPAYTELRTKYRDFGSKFNQDGQSVTDKFTVRHESTVDYQYSCNCTTDKDGNESCQTCTHNFPPRQFTIYALEDASNRRVETHESNSCAYFRYHNPLNPKTCKIEFITKDKADWVCRNNDGCFDELTKIRMADGTDRVVTQLRKGELVFNPVTGKAGRIEKLTIGPEVKPLIEVTVGSSTVRVTETHPFMTKRGWVMAKFLKLSDEVLSSGGRWDSIQKIQPGKAGRTVVNLALEGPAEKSDLHYVLADGVVTGDLVIQNLISPRAKTSVK